MGKQRIQSDLKKGGSADIPDSNENSPQLGASRNAFERAKKANMFGNELDNEIHSLHHYLKHYIISRGTNPPISTPSEKFVFSEYQVPIYFFMRCLYYTQLLFHSRMDLKGHSRAVSINPQPLLHILRCRVTLLPHHVEQLLWMMNMQRMLEQQLFV